VLARATVTFWRLGYEGASVRELADAMGITTQSLYAAFQSKEKLYGQALDHYISNFGSFMVEALVAESSVIISLQRFFRKAAQVFASKDTPRGCMISSGALAAGIDNLAAAALTTALRDKLKAALQDKLVAGVASGELVEATPIAALARFLAASLQGMSVQAKDGATEHELLDIARFIEDQVDRYRARKDASARKRTERTRSHQRETKAAGTKPLRRSKLRSKA
jgi:AcrR family transcriptional regulator